MRKEAKIDRAKVRKLTAPEVAARRHQAQLVLEVNAWRWRLSAGESYDPDSPQSIVRTQELVLIGTGDYPLFFQLLDGEQPYRLPRRVEVTIPLTDAPPENDAGHMEFPDGEGMPQIPDSIPSAFATVPMLPAEAERVFRLIERRGCRVRLALFVMPSHTDGMRGFWDMNNDFPASVTGYYVIAEIPGAEE